MDGQRDLCREIVERRGWTLVGEFVDSSISASDARKVRPGCDALVTAYAEGQFDALVCNDIDRLTRQPRQMEDWLDAAVDHGLALVTANGEADLRTDAGRTFVRVRTASARGEVERKSARQRDAAFQRRITVGLRSASDSPATPQGVRPCPSRPRSSDECSR
ncbi:MULTISPECIES: recombinase family protein [Nocardiaceae]|uniref:recombinase family protein n=1 Tax=Nocardiaceae TaxID=85025 RepID=UPI001F2DAA34|nr:MULTISPECIES: recombinase family protein [Rhodococcus]